MKKIFFSVIISLGIIVSSIAIAAPPANAVTCDKQFFAANNILFYNPCADICSQKNPASVSVGNSNSSLPSATTTYLDSLNIKARSEASMERYVFAESKTGVPWQAIAALHYRESGMDTTKSLFGEALGSGTNADGQDVVADPNQDALNATEFMIKVAQSVYGINPSVSPEKLSIEQWGQAMLAFHGGFLYSQNGKTYDQSTYVMNGFDDRHLNMKWLSGEVNTDEAAAGGAVDSNKAGTLAVMAYLGGVKIESDCTGSGAVAGDIVQTALNYANDVPAADGETDPALAKKIYLEAMPQFNGSSGDTSYVVTDCGRFVSTVYHASGADTDFPAVGVGSMITYMDGSAKYKALGAIQFADLKPGDILATPGHIILFTGENGDYAAADASLNQRVPSVRKPGSPMSMLSDGALVWRLK